MSQKRLEKIERRLLSLLFFIFLALIAIASRLIFIQGVKAKQYNALARKQRVRQVELAPHRGTLYDRDGQELAISLEANTVFATPYLVKHPSHAATKLSEILKVDRKDLLEKLTRPNCGFVYLARKIDHQKAVEVRKLKIEGIELLKESKRYYPCKTLAAHVIGFVGAENNGLSGMELYLDRYLRGIPGQIVAEKDPLGRDIPGGFTKLSPSSDGNTATLTLDKDIQYKAEVELKRCIENYHAKGGSVIVMNPKTGDIYALANQPTFDPNKFSEAETESLRNRAVTDIYEPGSTFKAIIASAAINEGVFETGTWFHLPSTIKVANSVIGEAHERPAKDFTLTDIVKVSSNVGAATIGMKLGKEVLYKYFTAFGLREKTGIDFPGEVKGYVLPPDEWSGSTIGTVSFGQGISVTPMQLTRAFAAIANDGVMVRPYLISRVVSPQGRTIKTTMPEEGDPVISPKTCQDVRYMLEKVVTEGTGSSAKIAGYRVAGKTGTAQKPRENGRGYDPGRYVSSFLGFAPAQEPQLVVSVIIDEPKDTIWGGAVAAPVFKNVTEFSLHHLKIRP